MLQEIFNDSVENENVSHSSDEGVNVVCAMAQAVSCRTVEGLVSPCGICALGQVFPKFGLPLYYSTMVPCSYVTWGMSNRPVGGHSSQVWSRPIDMIIIVIQGLYILTLKEHNDQKTCIST